MAALARELGPLDLDRAVTIAAASSGEARHEVVLVGEYPEGTQLEVTEGFFSRSYASVEPIPLVSYISRPTFPKIIRTVFIVMRS